MSKGVIRQLDEFTASQIAAGEVVERPASVVKELVENALDAGAGQVEIRIRGSEDMGAIGVIEVADDGCGIYPEDLARAFGRHATSKLAAPADLASISTLGFRGEALPSIAAVSRVEIASCAAGELCGWRIGCEGGKLDEPSEVAIARGTRVRVADLFYNTPARRKFLKSYALECGHISRLVGDFILARPEVAFSLKIDGRQVLRSPGGKNGAAKAVLAVYGPEVLAALRPIKYAAGLMQVGGYASAPPFARSSRRYYHFFVNGRLIKSQELGEIVGLAYQSLLPEKRYPLVILNLRLPYDSVDINVHPAKTEIKFKALREVREGVLAALRQGLAPRVDSEGGLSERHDDINIDINIIEENMANNMNNNINNKNTYNNEEKKAEGADGLALLQAFMNAGSERSERSETSRAAEPELELDYNLAGGEPKAELEPEFDLKKMSGAEMASMLAEGQEEPGFAAKLFENLMANAPGRRVEYSRDDGEWLAENFGVTYLDKEPEQQQLFGNNENLFYALRPLGQLNNSYIIATLKEDLYIIDQHAAHERILYEEFALAFALDARETSMLAAPVRIDVGALNCELLLNNIDRLADFGFVLEHFGGSSFVLRGVPLWYVRGAESDHKRKSDIYENDLGGFFLEVLDMLLEGSEGDATGELPDIAGLNRLELFTKACKSAIKANEHLNNQEIGWLLHNLAECDKPQTCPHGRPTYIKLEDGEIRRRFMRS